MYATLAATEVTSRIFWARTRLSFAPPHFGGYVVNGL